MRHKSQRKQQTERFWQSVDTPLSVGWVPKYGACIDANNDTYEPNLGGKRLSSGYSSDELLGICDTWPPKGNISDQTRSMPLYRSSPPSSNPRGESEKLSLLHRIAKVIPCLGILLSLTSSFFLGSANMLVKMIKSVDGIQIALFRGVIQMLIFSAVICVKTRSLKPAKGEVLPVSGRAILGAISVTATYHAIQMIPLGDATTIRFSLPIWTLVISYLALGESCSILKTGAVFIAVVGVFCIAKPDVGEHVFDVAAGLFANSQPELASSPSSEVIIEPPDGTGENSRQLEGSLWALLSSVCLSFSIVSLRLCKKTPVEVTIFWVSVMSIGTSVAMLVLIGDFRWPDNWTDLNLIGLNGLLSAIGQWFITSALKVEQSGVIALVRTFDIEVAFFYSAFLLHEHIRITSIVGAILVSSGVLLVLVPKYLEDRRKAKIIGHDNEAA